ncbi:MAG: phage protease, partial [Candidatus Thorarchaeota archaeon]
MSYVDLTDVVPAPERYSGYVVDLSSVQFEELGDAEASWVHALSLGSFKHPLWGEMSFTPERIQRFETNVNNNVRGIDIAIDYSHKNADEAAGWVRRAETRENGLWLFVEWTKQAAQRIRDKEFRYFSSEFVDEWVSEAGQKFKDVILGGGLTNRPFLKNLLPVNLSELYDEKEEEKEDESMELTELLETLGLSEEATEEDALAAIKLLQEETTPPDDDVDDEVIKLAEENPVVKALIDEVAELKTARSLAE